MKKTLLHMVRRAHGSCAPNNIEGSIQLKAFTFGSKRKLTSLFMKFRTLTGLTEKSKILDLCDLWVRISNGNASETKANECFDNGVFFDIEAKRTPSILSKLFSKRSEHIR